MPTLRLLACLLLAPPVLQAAPPGLPPAPQQQAQTAAAAEAQELLRQSFGNAELVVEGIVRPPLPVISSGWMLWSAEVKVSTVFKGDPALQGQTIRLQAFGIAGDAAGDDTSKRFSGGASRVLFLKPTGRSSPAWEVTDRDLRASVRSTADEPGLVERVHLLAKEAWPFK